MHKSLGEFISKTYKINKKLALKDYFKPHIGMLEYIHNNHLHI